MLPINYIKLCLIWILSCFFDWQEVWPQWADINPFIRRRSSNSRYTVLVSKHQCVLWWLLLLSWHFLYMRQIIVCTVWAVIFSFRDFSVLVKTCFKQILSICYLFNIFVVIKSDCASLKIPSSGWCLVLLAVVVKLRMVGLPLLALPWRITTLFGVIMCICVCFLAVKPIPSSASRYTFMVCEYEFSLCYSNIDSFAQDTNVSNECQVYT